MLPIGGGTITGNLGVAGTTTLTGALTAAGATTLSTLQVNSTADFLDGVTIDGDDAATKPWVDDAIAAGSLWQGTWDAENNVPDLTNAALQKNSFTWAITLTDPTAPFDIPATPVLPGLNGLTVYNGDHVTWSTTANAFQVVHGSSLSLAEAQDMFETKGQITFRPMTPNLYNWIPIGLEGTFVGEGAAIANAPTAGTWRYLAFAKASGALNLLAFEDAGGPMRGGPLASRSQRILRKKRGGGGTLATDNWSDATGAPGLPAGWGEYQRPLYASENPGDNANFMKVSGRNLLQQVPGGNINIGPRHTGASAYLNPYNMNVDHRRLIYSGAGTQTNRLHVLSNIWNLRNVLRAGIVSPGNRNDCTSERIQINLNFNKEEQNTSFDNQVIYRRWTGGNYSRLGITMSVPWAGPNLVYSPSNVRTFQILRRTVFVDCRAMSASSRWINADASNLTPQTQVQGMAFYYPRTANLRVQHVSPSTDNTPSGKIYKIVVEVHPVFDTCVVTVTNHAAPLYTSALSNRPGT